MATVPATPENLIFFYNFFCCEWSKSNLFQCQNKASCELILVNVKNIKCIYSPKCKIEKKCNMLMQTSSPPHKLCTNPTIPRASDMQWCIGSKWVANHLNPMNP